MSQENVADKRWFTNSQIVKGAIGMATVIGIWYRMELKISEGFGQLVKTIEVHMAEDTKDKKRIDERIEELQAKVNRMEQQAEDFVRNEYIRPSEPKPETERRRR